MTFVYSFLFENLAMQEKDNILAGGEAIFFRRRAESATDKIIS